MDELSEAPVRSWRRAPLTESAGSFEQLVLGQLDRSYRLAAVILGSEIEAEDAVSDAALRAWRSRHRLRDPERFEAWFGRIVVNTCRDRLRSRRRLPVIDVLPSGMDEPTGPGDFRDVVHARDEVERSFEGLSADDRMVLVLRFWADLSVDAIADRLDLPAGTVKSRLHHAMARLRAGLTRPEANR